MKQKISILGCGWLGMAVAVDLIKNGFEILGSTTTVERISELEKEGITPFLIDLSASTGNIQEFLDCEVLIISVTSKSIVNFQALIQKIEESRIQKVLFISSTSVYPNINKVVTEETTTLSSELAEIERLFINNPKFRTTVLRFGGLFGFDRKPGNFIRPNKLIENPEGYINFIHRDDCVDIIKQIIFKNAWGEIFNACSDDHPSRRDFYTRESIKVNRDSIEFDENSKNEFKIVSSEKLKTKLGYRFKYSSLMN